MAIGRVLGEGLQAALGAAGPGLPSPLLLPQDSTLSEDSPPPSASPRLPGPAATKCSYPYHTLSQSSDEVSPGEGGTRSGVPPTPGAGETPHLPH